MASAELGADGVAAPVDAPPEPLARLLVRTPVGLRVEGGGLGFTAVVIGADPVIGAAMLVQTIPWCGGDTPPLHEASGSAPITTAAKPKPPPPSTPTGVRTRSQTRGSGGPPAQAEPRLRASKDRAWCGRCHQPAQALAVHLCAPPYRCSDAQPG